MRVAELGVAEPASAMTLSAWIQPTAAQSGWRTIMQRETDAYFLNASNGDRAAAPCGRWDLRWREPAGIGGPTANPVNAWTHVALTYDGSTLRLYVNGTQVATHAGAAARSRPPTNPLWIGGNSPYGEYFQGLIDEVRVYNRALTAGRDPGRHEHRRSCRRRRTRRRRRRRRR